MLKRLTVIHSDARAPANALEWSLVVILFYNVLFIAPFIMKSFFWGLNWPLRILTYTTSLALMLRHRPDPSRIHGLLNRPSIFVFMLFYSGYLVAVTASSLWGYKHYDNWLTGQPFNPLPNLIGTWLLVLFGFAFAAYCDLRLIRWILDRFTDLILVCAVMAVILTPILYYEWMEPLSKTAVQAEGMQNLPEWQAYQQFYGLGFHRDWATIAGFRLPRAQSFAQEGGAFAFPLVVALLWALRRQRMVAAAIMGIALVLTWSVGTFAFCALLPMLYAFRRPLNGLLILSGALLALALMIGADVINGDTFTEYLAGKLEGSDSSLGGRMQDMHELWSLVLDEHWLGFGAGAILFVTPVSITTSALAPLANGGVLGFTLWLCAYLVLALQSLRLTLWGNAEQRSFGIVMLLLFCLAVQRPSLDSGLLVWFLIAGTLLQLLSGKPGVDRFDGAGNPGPAAES